MADLTKMIASSDAYRSLVAERDVATHLRTLGWRSSQSPYYTDILTGKAREIDVIATRYWEKPRKSRDILARVNLFVEVKSARDFHILCAGEAASQCSFGSNEHWLGYSSKALVRIEERLLAFRLEHALVKRFMHRVEQIAFPRNTMRTASLRAKPVNAQYCFSAFRETNGKLEKDLDNSVLWRAASALRSSVRSAQNDIVEAMLEDINIDLEVACRRKIDPIEMASGTIERHACTLNLYSPAIIVDSYLWSAQDDNPLEIEWFRFVQLGTYGELLWWVDVVNRRYLNNYFQALSKHFEEFFRTVRAKEF